MSRTPSTPEAVRELHRGRVYERIAVSEVPLSHLDLEKLLPHITRHHLYLAVAELAASGRIAGRTVARRHWLSGLEYSVRVYSPVVPEGESGGAP